VQVRRRHRQGSDEFLVVTLPDNTLAQIPAWMTQPDRCTPMHLAESPRCSVGSLRALRDLIDRLRGGASQAPEVPSHPGSGEGRADEAHGPQQTAPTALQLGSPRVDGDGACNPAPSGGPPATAHAAGVSAVAGGEA
jgi:hypothetical protein